MSTHQERRDQIHHAMPELHSQRVLYYPVSVELTTRKALLDLETDMHMPTPKSIMPNEDVTLSTETLNCLESST